MTVNEALIKGKKILSKENTEDAGLTTKIFLAYILNITREELIVNYDKEINKKDEEKFFIRNK